MSAEGIRKSTAFWRMWAFAVIGSVPVLFVKYAGLAGGWFDWVLFAWVGVFGVLALRTCCENCGVRVLRYDKEGAGLIDIRGLIAWRECPKCGISRGGR